MSLNEKKKKLGFATSLCKSNEEAGGHPALFSGTEQKPFVT